MSRETIVYALADRPPVEVVVDGTWCFGILRMWTPVGDDGWVADVQYYPPGQITSYLDSFPADQVREDTVDRSYGRS